MVIDKKYIIIGAVVVLLLVATTASASNSGVMKTSYLGSGYVRGIRNNNPLNIKYSASRDYMGKIPLAQNTDKVHEQFESMVFGIAAAIEHMTQRYISRSGWTVPNCAGQSYTSPFDTLRLIANVWAPKGCDASATLPGGNNPDAYISFVNKKTGINPDAKISPTDKDTLKKLIWGMALYENGTKFESDILSWANWDKMFNAAWSILQ